MKTLMMGLLLTVSQAANAHEVSIKLLGASPLNEVSTTRGTTQDGSSSAGFALEYVRPVYKKLSLGGELSLMPRGEVKAGSLLGPVIDLAVSGETLAFLGLARLDVAELHGMRLYAAGGLGFASVSRKAVATPRPGTVWVATGESSPKTLVDSSSLVPAWAIRGGVDGVLKDRWIVGAELGYLGTGEASHEMTAEARQVLGAQPPIAAASESFVFALKAGFKF